MQGINWGDVPTWLAVIVATFGGSVALRQLRQQGNVIKGEIDRNKARDELLDRQLRELEQRSLVAERQQAEAVSTELATGSQAPAVYMANVTNNSGRPIRNVTCALNRGNPGDALFAASFGLLLDWAPGREVLSRVVSGAEPGRTIPVLRAGLRYAFVFESGPGDAPGATLAVRFTDDAGMHWEVDHDLHLAKLDSRDDW